MSTPSTHRRGLLLLLSLAGAPRVGTGLQMRGGPIADLHRWDQSDMRFFYDWAGAIRAGDVLTSRETKPYHEWHAGIARMALGGEPISEQRGRSLWREWLGEKTFYQDPLYPYLLAGILKLTDGRVGVVFLVQALLGVVNVLLVF